MAYTTVSTVRTPPLPTRLPSTSCCSLRIKIACTLSWEYGKALIKYPTTRQSIIPHTPPYKSQLSTTMKILLCCCLLQAVQPYRIQTTRMHALYSSTGPLKRKTSEINQIWGLESSNCSPTLPYIGSYSKQNKHALVDSPKKREIQSEIDFHFSYERGRYRKKKKKMRGFHVHWQHWLSINSNQTPGKKLRWVIFCFNRTSGESSFCFLVRTNLNVSI